MANPIVPRHASSCQPPSIPLTQQPQLFRLVPIFRDGIAARHIILHGSDIDPTPTIPTRELTPNPAGGYFYGPTPAEEVAHA